MAFSQKIAIQNRDLEELYTKFVPRIDRREVYILHEESWVKQPGIHFNTGFIEKHLAGQFILGYKVFNKISQFLLLSIDRTRLKQVIDIVGKPSFLDSFKDRIYLYYVFKEKYYCQDIEASFKAKFPDLDFVEVLPRQDSVLPLPCSSLSSFSFSDLQSTFFTYDSINSICPHKKTYHKYTSHPELVEADHKSYTDLLKISGTKNNYPSVAFRKDNLKNSLIQLFNRYRGNEEGYLHQCDLEDEKMKHFWKDPAIDIELWNRKERFNHYKGVYHYLLQLKDKVKYKTKHKQSIKTNLTPYQIHRIKKYLRTLPGYKTLKIKRMKKKKAQEKFLNFSLKIINQFHLQATKTKNKIYYLPSTYMLKLDKNYNLFKNILFPYITKTEKEYSNYSVNYRCRGYNLDTFRITIKHILIYKTILISYYNINIHDLYRLSNIPSQRLIQNYYNIFPDLKRHFKPKNRMMESMGFQWVPDLKISFRFGSKWCIYKEPID